MPASSFVPNHPRVRVVGSFVELVSTPFEHGVNALCWPRVLEGGFAEVIHHLVVGQGITHLTESDLRALPVSAAGRVAIAAMLADLHLLREHGLEPTLDCINGYLPVEDPGLLRTDVCSFHVDSATCEADTYLCTYFGAASEGLRNEEAVRHVDVPETRAGLLKAYGGADGADFLGWLSDHYYDLHYAALSDAKPFSFGVGNLWRVATLHDGCPVPPCIHRAPDPVPGQKRLLLIS